MNFDFSDLQKELADQVQRALAKLCPIEEVRRVAETSSRYSEESWRTLGEMGALGAAVPEEYGGAGLGILELCAVAEQLGRALAPVPFLSSVGIVGQALIQYGTDEQKAKWLPRLASGEAIGCVADIETPGEIDPDTLATRFAGGRVTGTKPVVFDGQAADVALVLAQSTDGVRLLLVDLAQVGVVRRDVPAIDAAISVANVRFSDAHAEQLGLEAGWEAYRKILDMAAVLAAFEALGAAEETLIHSLNYAKQRKAFGRELASYQAIKHKLAQAYVKIQLARANCYYAAWTAQVGDQSFETAAPSAFLSALDAFSWIAQENNQVHGGICFTWEANCHFYYKRSKVLATRLGNRLEWKDRLVDRIEREAATPVDLAA